MPATRIGLITLGGTIATTRGSAPAPCQGGQTLLERAGLSTEHGPIQDLRLLRGSQLEMEDAEAVIHAVRDLIAEPTTGGVVITTGTATLEEVAFLLAVTVPATKPVLVTGAARVFDDESWGGAQNLRDAFTAARHSDADLRGVTIAFGGMLHSPLLACKVADKDTVTIESPPIGPLGLIQQEAVALRYRSVGLHLGWEQSSLKRQVVIWSVGLGDSGVPLALLKDAVDGLVIVGFPGPALGLPGPILALARELLDRDTLVAYTSRSSAICPSTVSREEPRMLVSEYLTPTKLRLLIMVATGRAHLRSELQEALRLMDDRIRTIQRALAFSNAG